MSQADEESPDRMRQRARALREKAHTIETPGYAEQLLQAAEDLENYADKTERRG